MNHYIFSHIQSHLSNSKSIEDHKIVQITKVRITEVPTLPLFSWEIFRGSEKFVRISKSLNHMISSYRELTVDIIDSRWCLLLVKLHLCQIIRTVSKFHSLIYQLYPTNHRSSLEYAIYVTSCLLPAFLSPTTCHLSNLRSINLIWSLSLLLAFHFLLPSFVRLCIGHHGLSST